MSNIQGNTQYNDREKVRTTVTIPYDILQRAKHMAIERNDDLSSLMSRALLNILEQEDVALASLAQKRDKSGVKFVSHKEVWGN